MNSFVKMAVFKTAFVAVGLFAIVFSAIYFIVPAVNQEDCSRFGATYENYLIAVKSEMADGKVKENSLEEDQLNFILDKYYLSTPDNKELAKNTGLTGIIIGSDLYPTQLAIVLVDSDYMVCTIAPYYVKNFVADMQELEESKK